ncbi:MAG TPA: substrate-binding domain-containing protein [Anaerolinea sp.]|nr:substrate-binding domain-containing protein [Anaerolinea sp.]
MPPNLYQRIADQIRQDILEGRLQPGDRLPPIRELARAWNCTLGTVQRAYQDLTRQGLAVSQAGKGTHVAGTIDPLLLQAQGPLRRAGLVHRAEAFLLEVLTAGHSLAEVQQAFDLALDRWRAIQPNPGRPAPGGRSLRFFGSHDLALTWLAAHLDEFLPGWAVELNFTGSLGGLIALAEGRADLAGAHLWDASTRTYNLPFISRLFPGQRMLVVRLAQRRSGLILAPGNPLGIQSLADLARPGVRFANRQGGSGTRVWLDAELDAQGISPRSIHGYENEKLTHSEVARAVAEGAADAGLGLETAAAAFSLDFHFLVEEPYDLVTYAERAEAAPLEALFAVLASARGRQAIGALRGYDASRTGEIIRVG